MKTIAENKDGLKIHVGSAATIMADAQGKVLSQRPAGTRPVMVISGREDATLKVGSNAEINAEKAVQEAKYAPVKAALEAATVK